MLAEALQKEGMGVKVQRQLLPGSDQVKNVALLVDGLNSAGEDMLYSIFGTFRFQCVRMMSEDESLFNPIFPILMKASAWSAKDEASLWGRWCQKRSDLFMKQAKALYEKFTPGSREHEGAKKLQARAYVSYNNALKILQGQEPLTDERMPEFVHNLVRKHLGRT